MELAPLPAALGHQRSALAPLLLKARLGLGVTVGHVHATAARQLEHRLLKAQALPVLQPADGIGALAADKAVHPVALWAHGERRPPVLMPRAGRDELRSGLAQLCGAEEIDDAGALAHLLQQRRGDHRHSTPG